jgi:hypothetical protein
VLERNTNRELWCRRVDRREKLDGVGVALLKADGSCDLRKENGALRLRCGIGCGAESALRSGRIVEIPEGVDELLVRLRGGYDVVQIRQITR